MQVVPGTCGGLSSSRTVRLPYSRSLAEAEVQAGRLNVLPVLFRLPDDEAAFPICLCLESIGNH